MSDFHNKLSDYVATNNAKAANVLVIRELGNIIVKNKKDFVDLLNECGIHANESMSDTELVDLYINNIINKKLLLGTSLLVNMHNKTMGADGKHEINDEGVKCCYDAMNVEFGGYGPDNDLTIEDYSNVGGLFGGILDKGLDFAKQIQKGQQKKKYGAQDLLAKKMSAKNALAQSILAERRAKIDAANKVEAERSKRIKIAVIAGSSILVIAAITIAVYYIKKHRK